ncbi:thiamine-phosphate synthase family protein [Methanothermobacter wolfeii]|uniref:thiamine-phosphate synthase family protein n=1 Tax=Methanothermobacter wolfeii TaxID=145261 RepID=UPI0024B3751D|nr:thiamine-phosphate synthase family protein [Methanothermobacter wolfeii]MDI6702282.1 thiamine-phosphate synthase family protein [Methanothermobacter wolfeii]
MEIENLKRALELLSSSDDFGLLVPEVRSNIVMAREGAKDTEDVAAVPGRITEFRGKAFACREPEYGASSHMARFILTFMRHRPERRAAINIKFDESIIRICEKAGLVVSCYDRSREPASVRDSEGGTIPWGVEEAFRDSESPPDVIYHRGAWGKEPMVVLTGKDAVEVAETALKIAEEYRVLMERI